MPLGFWTGRTQRGQRGETSRRFGGVVFDVWRAAKAREGGGGRTFMARASGEWQAVRKASPVHARIACERARKTVKRVQLRCWRWADRGRSKPSSVAALKRPRKRSTLRTTVGECDGEWARDREGREWEDSPN